MQKQKTIVGQRQDSLYGATSSIVFKVFNALSNLVEFPQTRKKCHLGRTASCKLKKKKQGLYKQTKAILSESPKATSGWF